MNGETPVEERVREVEGKINSHLAVWEQMTWVDWREGMEKRVRSLEGRVAAIVVGAAVVGQLLGAVVKYLLKI